MGVTRNVPSELAELSEQERGGEKGEPNRFASARFVVRVPSADEAEAETADEDPAAAGDAAADVGSAVDTDEPEPPPAS